MVEPLGALSMPEKNREQRTRIQIALLSITAGALILGLKFLAFKVSGSTALMSDARRAQGVVFRTSPRSAVCLSIIA